MDLKLKQWRKQDESEEEHSANMLKFLPKPHQHPQSYASDPNTRVSTLSALSDSTRLPRMGYYYFSFSQWQELQLQALIFSTLFNIIDLLLMLKGLVFEHVDCTAPVLESGYLGRAALDPEPSRCRRTDGKKWRCSRDVVAGQKYCERHLHRGRNRSRKPVEQRDGVAGSLPATTSISSSRSLPPPSFNSPFNLPHLNERSSGTKNESKSLFENQDHVDGNGRSDGNILRHFFDDWPRTLQEPSNGESNAGKVNTGKRLSISMAGNTSSDVSLKLSTGSGGGDVCLRNGNVEAQQVQLNWGEEWRSASHVTSMGGPLAEALRSSTSASSPTSVMLQLPRSSASKTSFNGS
ncbi:hypothetical protein VNO77_15990 [Canavalia gladiata]|uniref:Growth-regulating factor n=1 Tax=Canavalia gladiata TaxID=3824 RepID=A0AAN9M0X8_CANGL